MRNLSRNLAGLAFGLALSVSASAQVLAPTFRDQSGQIRQADGVLPLRPDGTTAAVPIPVGSTPTAGSVATANAFQTALAANGARKGCAIYNTSSATELVFLGAPANATVGASIPVPAGGSFNCGGYQGTVATDQISITSGTAGATFVVISQ